MSEELYYNEENCIQDSKPYSLNQDWRKRRRCRSQSVQREKSGPCNWNFGKQEDALLKIKKTQEVMYF